MLLFSVTLECERIFFECHPIVDIRCFADKVDTNLQQVNITLVAVWQMTEKNWKTIRTCVYSS